MDRDRARSAFDAYVSAYDPDNPRIALKADHTWKVAELCDRLAHGLGMCQDDTDLAWMLGLLHDIGRFEQVRRYDTFNDAASVAHAALGTTVLFDEPDTQGRLLVRRFYDDEGLDALVRTAIGVHSDYRLSDDLDDRTRTFCELLRDADKIDILRVNCECPIQDIYGVSEGDMCASPLTPACVDIFYEHRCLPRGVRQHPADIMLGHICFAWELVFPQSREIVREQGHLHQMLSRHWDRAATQEAFEGIAAHMHAELGI